MGPTRFALVLIVAFAVIAAVLAAVGLYGVLSTLVRHRTPELGVRMALGAPRSLIVRLVRRHGFRLSAFGVAAGLVVALALTQGMRNMLVGVAPTHPLTFIAMVAFFGEMAAAASYVPARRGRARPERRAAAGVAHELRLEALTGVTYPLKMTHMVKTQVYLRDEELEALHRVAERSGRSVADLVREAIRRVWLRPPAQGPVALWDGPAVHTSVEHDHIYDAP